jgi:chromosome segregation ATPase
MVSRTSGPVVFLLSMLFIGMCATGAAGYYFYLEGEADKEALQRATTRIAQMENHLNMVDQAAEQSSMDLVQRVNFNFSEIDKLWAARNTLRTEVGDLKTSMTAVQGSTKGLEEIVSSHSKTLDENVVKIQARIDEINKNFAGMDNLGQQLTLLNADLNRVKTTMTDMEDKFTASLADLARERESLILFRQQTLETIRNLQDNINRLQAQVGQSPPR